MNDKFPVVANLVVDDKRLPAVEEKSSIDAISAILQTARAIVFLSVPWSGPERLSRQVFRQTEARLNEQYPMLGINHFVLDEDAEATQAWLASLSVPGLGEGYSLGAGSVLWLERGRVVASEICANSKSMKEMVAQSLSLWGLPSS